VSTVSRSARERGRPLFRCDDIGIKV